MLNRNGPTLGPLSFGGPMYDTKQSKVGGKDHKTTVTHAYSDKGGMPGKAIQGFGGHRTSSMACCDNKAHGGKSPGSAVQGFNGGLKQGKI